MSVTHKMKLKISKKSKLKKKIKSNYSVSYDRYTFPMHLYMSWHMTILTGATVFRRTPKSMTHKHHVSQDKHVASPALHITFI